MTRRIVDKQEETANTFSLCFTESDSNYEERLKQLVQEAQEVKTPWVA